MLKKLQNHTHFRFLMSIILLSVLLRTGVAIYLGDVVVPLPGTADQLSYHYLAMRVMEGHGFSFSSPWWPMTRANAPTAHWSFLYTFFLAAIYFLFGPHPIIARLIQAILVGVLHPLLAYLLTREAFRYSFDSQIIHHNLSKIALLAAAITAFYGYFVYYAGTLMTEPFYITSILAILWLSIRYINQTRIASESRDLKSDRQTWQFACQLGVLLAVAVLLRQLFLLFIPFLFGWLLWQARYHNRMRLMIAQLAIAGGILIITIVPFTIYNYMRFNRLVLLNTNAGFALYLANHPIYGTRFIDILPREIATYADLIPLELRHLDEAALDQALLRRAFKIILDDPVRYLLLSLSRIPSYFKFWPTENSHLASNLTRVGSFGLFLPFMLVGLVRSLRYRPHNSLQLLYLFSAIYTGIHVFSWTLIRYRLPVDAVWISFAAYGIYTSICWYRSRFFSKEKSESSARGFEPRAR